MNVLQYRELREQQLKRLAKAAQDKADDYYFRVNDARTRRAMRIDAGRRVWPVASEREQQDALMRAIHRREQAEEAALRERLLGQGPKNNLSPRFYQPTLTPRDYLAMRKRRQP